MQTDKTLNATVNQMSCQLHSLIRRAVSSIIQRHNIMFIVIGV